MKKLVKTITLLSTTILVGMVVFFACKKEITEVSNPSSIYEISNSPGNPLRNPFDINYEYLMEICQDVAEFLSTMEDNPDYEDFEIFMKDFNKLIAKYNNNPYLPFELEAFSSSEQSIIINLLDDYMSNIDIYGLEEASRMVENNISQMRDENFKQSMYSLVSQLKFTLEFLDIYTEISRKPQKPSSEERMVNCLKKKADDLWENGNAFDKAGFLAGLPASALRWMGSCAWDVAFRPDLHWKPY
ncbi:MAG: hypothetical protein FWC41_11450 [Firmicutes bacterium]|nr:hypothetical protein [Bacillota bacterium]